MTVMRFVDTNILLYRISTDPVEATKQAIAEDLLKAADLAVSIQVFQEFYVQATRASRPDAIAHEDAVSLIRSWKRFQVLSLTPELLDAALVARERWQLSYWDAAVIEAARLAQCEVILSEDLNAGQDYAGIRVLNPFAATGA